MNDIQKISKRLRILFQCMLAIVPIGVLGFWLSATSNYDFHQLTGLGINVADFTSYPLTATSKGLALLLSGLLTLIPLYALVKLIRLFKNYENMQLFTLDNAITYHQLGRSLLLWVVCGFIYGGIMSVVLSFNNPPGERVISLSFTGIDFLALICAFLVMVISRVMQKGYSLAEENSHTI